jgi:hypothetical protein
MRISRELVWQTAFCFMFSFIALRYSKGNERTESLTVLTVAHFVLFIKQCGISFLHDTN